MMENQVTSIEQSQRLLELGIPTEKASLVWTTVDDNETVVERDLCLPENIEGYAFTVADMLGMLPVEINGHFMVIRTYGKFWIEIRYERIVIIEGQKCAAVLLMKTGSTLLNAAYNMLESYAKSKGQKEKVIQK